MTSYGVIYDRFLNTMTDFDLAGLDDHILRNMLKGWLCSAIVKVRPETDLSDRDDEKEEFNVELVDMDIELLAMGMKLAWLDQRINSTEYTSLFVGGKEEKFYSPSSQLAELRALRADILHEMQQLYTYNTYNQNSYFD